LKPGGWLQLIEMDVDPNPENPPVISEFMALMLTLFTNHMGGNFAKEIKSWMEEAGLKDVQEKVVMAAFGETIGDKSLKQKSINSPCSAIAPMLAVMKCESGISKNRCFWLRR
jgi:pseurotin biosynthesis methyltransferase